jgi:hypothetical protein
MTPEATSLDERRELRKQQKAEADKKRRALIKAVDKALETARLHRNGEDFIVVQNGEETELPLATYTDLDKEQRERAATYTAGHGGLVGKSLATYILEGKTGRQQEAEGEQNRRAEARAAKRQKGERKAKDPDAAALAHRAQDIAREMGLKSAYLVKEAREVLDGFTVEPNNGDVVVTPLNGDPRTLPLQALEAAASGKKEDEAASVRKDLRELASGTGVYARKLACFLLAVRAGHKEPSES